MRGGLDQPIGYVACSRHALLKEMVHFFGPEQLGGMKLGSDGSSENRKDWICKPLCLLWLAKIALSTSVLRFGDAKYVDVNVYSGSCPSALQEPRSNLADP